MKLNKLLLVSVAFMLGLSACQKAPKKDDSKPDSESQSESIPPEPVPVKSLFYLDEGESEGFPDDAVAEFLEFYELDTEVFSIAEQQDWVYSVTLSEYAQPYIYLSTTDDNAPNSSNPDPTGEALEDDYKALLEEEGVVVDDSSYSSSGYNVYGEGDELLYTFYSWDGYFELFIYANIIETDEISQELLDYFFYQSALMEGVEIPLPESENPWSYYFEFDGSDSYIDIDTTDLNAPNSDNLGPNGEAIEDAYKEILEDAGWTVDDTSYDDDGYYASSDELPEITIFFYSWNDMFEVEFSFSFDEFPTEIVETFLDIIGGESENELPIPESDYSWGFDLVLYGEESYIGLYTEDDGTPGDDAIEDTYYALLNGNDWELDSSVYATIGYLAFSGNIELVFYSYKYEFDLYIMLNPTPSEL